MQEYQKRMDEAAKEAAKELVGALPADAVEVVAEWWAKWYRQAGHKRLGRLLVKYATVGIGEEDVE